LNKEATRKALGGGECGTSFFLANGEPAQKNLLHHVKVFDRFVCENAGGTGMHEEIGLSRKT
jgi:hypothetical protein